jgi:hypothetical protein
MPASALANLDSAMRRTGGATFPACAAAEIGQPAAHETESISAAVISSESVKLRMDMPSQWNCR